jgi:prophage regulatory protein
MSDRPRKSALPDRLPREGFVRLAVILRFVPVGRTTWMNGVRDGRYPRPIKLGRCNLWKARDIHAVIAAIESEGSQ